MTHRFSVLMGAGALIAMLMLAHPAIAQTDDPPPEQPSRDPFEHIQLGVAFEGYSTR